MYKEYGVKNVALGDELKHKFGARSQADGTIPKNRLIEENASGNIVVGVLDSIRAYAGNQDVERDADDFFLAETGTVNITAGSDLTAGQRFKCGTAGKAITLIDARVVGEVLGTHIGLAFTHQPSSDTINVVSSSASDITQTVTIYGTDATDAYITETLTLTGLTPANSTAVNWKAVCGILLSEACVGTVTVTTDTGPATIKAITIGDTSAGIYDITDGYAYNKIADIVGDGTDSGQVVLFHEATDGATSAGIPVDLNNSTEVALSAVSYKINNWMLGNVKAASTLSLTVNSTEDDRKLSIGTVLTGADAGDNAVCHI